MSILKISDSEFVFAEKLLETYLEKITTISNTYINCISTIRNEGLSDELINAKLSHLCDDVRGIANTVQEIQKSLDGTSNELIHEIDETDRFIY